MPKLFLLSTSVEKAQSVYFSEQLFIQFDFNEPFNKIS
jgi:hypothetical protein